MVRFGLHFGLLLSVPVVTGHSFMQEPTSRNVVAWQNNKMYCPHCLQAGGPGTVKSRGNGVWPTKDDYGSHGLCGDPVQNSPVTEWREEPYLKAGPITKTYTPGSIVEFEIGVSTHHKGHYEFRICDKAIDPDNIGSVKEGQQCLDKWVLERAELLPKCAQGDKGADCQPIDVDNPGRWYLPPPQYNTQVAGENWDDSEFKKKPDSTEVHKMRYKIPAALTCTHCTLQWYWSSGNSCLYDGGYLTYFKKMKDAGWNTQEWCQFCGDHDSCATAQCCKSGGPFGEEFWNCADIAVMAGDGPSPTPPSPSPTPPSPSPTPPSPSPSPSPTPTPTPSPSPTPADCNKEWHQCGGTDWSGPTCCESGSYCHYHGPCYSQCTPGGDAPPPSTCLELCGLTNLTSTAKKCSDYNSDKAACHNSFISKGGVFVPCTFTDCGCFANAEFLLTCPDQAARCSDGGAALFQSHIDASHRHRWKPSYLRGTGGMAFIAAASVGEDGQEHQAQQMEKTVLEL